MIGESPPAERVASGDFPEGGGEESPDRLDSAAFIDGIGIGIGIGIGVGIGVAIGLRGNGSIMIPIAIPIPIPTPTLSCTFRSQVCESHAKCGRRKAGRALSCLTWNHLRSVRCSLTC